MYFSNQFRYKKINYLKLTLPKEKKKCVQFAVSLKEVGSLTFQVGKLEMHVV